MKTRYPTIRYGLAIAFCILSAGAVRAIAAESVSLGSFARGDGGWKLYLAPEFPGAKGASTQMAVGPHPGDTSLALQGDFSGGGNYVAVWKHLIPAAGITKISLWVKAENMTGLGLRMVDLTGQTHQQRIPLKAIPGWQEITITKLAASSHWGGANDGVWHGPATAVGFLVEKQAVATTSPKEGTVYLSDIKADEEAVIPEKPLPAIHFDLSRKAMFFWGRADAPSKAALEITGTSSEACDVQMLNYKSELVRDLWKGTPVVEPGKPFRQELDITPPAFGVFYLVANLGKQRLGTPFAWVAARAQPWPESPFGVQTHFVMGPWGMHQNLGGAAGTLDLVRNMGASWIRDDISWGQAEREKGKVIIPMDATNQYFYVTPAATRQLQPLVNLNGGNVLYDNKQPPTSDGSLEAFKRFAAAAASKWGSVVKYWEVWNEPNIAPGWQGRKPSPEEYTALLKTAYEGIKSVDPAIKVVGVASCSVDLKFISDVLRLGGAKYMDVISVHQYQRSPPEFPNEKANGVVGMGLPDPGQTFVGQLKNLQAVLDRFGASRLKVWITETGCVPQGRGYTEAQVAAYNVRAYLLALGLPFIQEIFKYNFQDRAAPDSEHWDYVVGMVRADGSPKPSYVAYNTMARMLFKKHFVRSVPVGEGSYLYEFNGDGGWVFAAWSSNGKKALSLQAVGQVDMVDLMGNETTSPAKQTRLTLELTEEPIFLTSIQPLVPEQ